MTKRNDFHVHTNQPGHHSHLFTLRVWTEMVDAEEREWRGTVQHVSSGESRHFRDWSTLIDHVIALLKRVEGRGSEIEQ